MLQNQKDNPRKFGLRETFHRDVTALGNVRILCLAAMFAAMAVTLGSLAKFMFGTGPLRVTFENLPIIFCSVAFGPIVGGMCAFVADLCSCVIAGQALNPLISVGAVSIGVLSGIVSHYIVRNHRLWALVIVEFVAHVIGSIVLKTWALSFFFAWSILLWRIPIYFAILLVESYLLWVLLRNKHIHKLLEGVQKR